MSHFTTFAGDVWFLSHASASSTWARTSGPARSSSKNTLRITRLRTHAIAVMLSQYTVHPAPDGPASAASRSAVARAKNSPRFPLASANGPKAKASSPSPAPPIAEPSPSQTPRHSITQRVVSHAASTHSAGPTG